ncbi:hypothetical protein F383_24452 [Gossypium arboreum]|uniref:Uncharacterized protein n=1 Tax=Gossypium arboreum TaxID=29729 RepID=A0A0B0MLF9_GOSAR|nr:hypothetical protein F383_24452 [Gossypium arboreum]
MKEKQKDRRGVVREYSRKQLEKYH